MDRRFLRLGAAAIGFAILLRLMGAGALQPLALVLQRQELLSFLVYLETGRSVR